MDRIIPECPSYFEKILHSSGQSENESCKSQSFLNVIKDNQLKIALSISAVSIASTVTFQPFDETKSQLLDAAPWVGTGLIAGEVLWVSGAVMMASSVGKYVNGKNYLGSNTGNSNSQNPIPSTKDYFEKLINPSMYPDLNRGDLQYLRRIKRQLPELARYANSSKLFKSGLVINTVGAVSQFGIVTTGIALETPPSAWGLVSIGAIDLVATLAIRKSILDGIKNSSSTVNN